MLQYIGQRLMQLPLVLLGISALTFGLMFISGDPTAMIMGTNWTPEEIAQFRHELGFDRLWPVQYLDFVGSAVHGDLGDSLRQHRPVLELIAERLPATIQLGTAALLISVTLAIPVGVLSATRRNTIYDTVSRLGALLGQSLPDFWLGLMLILAFGVYLRWLPVSGRGGLTHVILPAVTMSAYFLARNMRLVRSSLLEILGQDYITTARAKGLPGWAVLYKHALRNALIPVVTIIGLQVGRLLGGAVIVETIFAWPGVGRLVFQAISSKDIPVVQGCVITMAMSCVFFNLVVDVAYSFIDPQIRYG